MSKKMIRTLIITVVAVLLVAALTITAVIVIPKLKKNEGGSADNPALTLVNRAANEVAQMEVQNQHGSLTFVKEGDAWTIQGSGDANLDSARISVALQGATLVKGTTLVQEGADNLEQFGFDAPSATVRATYTDGSAATYLVGAMTSDQSGYYAMMEGGEVVVTLSAGSAKSLLQNLDYFRVRYTVSLNADLVNRIRIERKGDLVMDCHDREEGDYANLYSWRMSEPWDWDLDINGLDNIINSLEGLAVTDLVVGQPENLADFGLDVPVHRLYVEDTTGARFDMSVGNQVPDMEELTYVRFEGDEAVYTMQTELLSFLSTASAYGAAEKRPGMIKVASLASVHFQGLGQDATLTINNVPRLKDDGTPELDSYNEQIYDQQYALDGAELSKQNGSNWYANLLGMAINGPIKEEGYTPTGEPAVVVTYNYDPNRVDLTEPTVISYYDYDQDYYAVSVDGNCYFIMRKDMMNSVVDGLNTLKSGGDLETE